MLTWNFHLKSSNGGGNSYTFLLTDWNGWNAYHISSSIKWQNNLSHILIWIIQIVSCYFAAEALKQFYFPILVPVGIIGNFLSFLVRLFCNIIEAHSILLDPCWMKGVLYYRPIATTCNYRLGTCWQQFTVSPAAVNDSKTMCLWTFQLTQYPAHMCEVH